MRKRTKIGLVLAGAFSLGLAGALVGARKTNLFDRRMDVQLQSGTISVPKYNLIKLGAGSCSQYVRLAAEDIFGKQYKPANAWDRRWNDRVVSILNGNQDLKRADELGLLKPGMVLGVYYPNSYYNGGEDMEGLPRQYTHVMLFLGHDPSGQPLFLEQFGTRVRTRTLEQFDEHKLEAREILDSWR